MLSLLKIALTVPFVATIISLSKFWEEITFQVYIGI